MERKTTGIELMHTVFGKESALAIEQRINGISPEFLSFLQETFSDIYGDSTLDLKTKEIIV